MERIQFDTLYFGGAPSSAVVWDTIDVTYNYADYTYLDLQELQVFESTNFGYADWVIIDTIFAGIAHKYVYDWYDYNEVEKCLSNPENNNMPEQLFGDGLGIMHYLDSTDINNYYALDLTYFKVGLNEWGTPYDFSDFDYTGIIINEQATVKVYPNPCYDVLNFNLQEMDCVATIFNVTGEMVMQTRVNAGQLNVTSLEPGLYYLKLNGLNNVALTQFVKM
jgi:hypothetical protein